MSLSRKTTAWLQEFRPPNLLTVPGDPLVGYLLAASGAAVFSPPLFLVMAVSVLLYGAGLLLNDLVDREKDARERPDRPLPSGRISVRLARLAASLMLASGLALALMAGRPAFRMALGLAAALLAYNFLTKRIPVVGPLTMGSCRGLSVMLGATLPGASALGPPVHAALFWTLYVAFVTHLARGEARPGGIRPERIGQLIGGLIPLQATACLMAGEGVTALFVLILWPAFHFVGRHFYSS